MWGGADRSSLWLDGRMMHDLVVEMSYDEMQTASGWSGRHLMMMMMMMRRRRFVIHFLFLLLHFLLLDHVNVSL